MDCMSEGNYWRDPVNVCVCTPAHMHVRVCVDVCVGVFVPAAGVQLWSSGAHVAPCKLLGSPEIQGKLPGRLSV